jgi:O-antigen/teichoic acid export membrane protein
MTMYGALYILNVPAETLRTAMAYFSALHHDRGSGPAAVAAAFRRIMQWLCVLAVPAVLLTVLAGPVVARYFHMEGRGPVVATALVCIGTMLMTTLQGVLQGVQCFGWYGVSVALWFGGRLVFAVALVYLGFRATGALTGMMLGALLALLLPAVALRRGLLRPSRRKAAAFHPSPGYIIRVLLVYGAFMFIGNIDVLAVKHLFDPERAGRFAQGALLAHMLWLIPYPIMLALFPKVVRCRLEGRSALGLMLKSLAVSMGIVLAVCAVLLLVPQWIFLLFFAVRAHPMIPYLPLYLAAMAPMAALFVLINYEMARGRFRMLALLAVAVLLLGSLLFREAVSLSGMLRFILYVNAGLVAAMGAMMAWTELHERRTAKKSHSSIASPYGDSVARRRNTNEVTD